MEYIRPKVLRNLFSLDSNWSILIVLCIGMLFQSFVLNSLYPLYIGQEEIFILSLLGISLRIPLWIILILNLVNGLLLWKIVRNTINNKVAWWSSLIYLTSPWILYLTSGGSFYIYLLSGWLIVIWGLSSRVVRLKLFLFLAGILFLLLSSLSMWIPVSVLMLVIFYRRFPIIERKLSLTIFLVTGLLIVVAITHRDALINIIYQQVGILSNIGIINTVNVFRGENIQAHNAFLGTIFENKYSYVLKVILGLFLKHFNPFLLFTPSSYFIENSFTPPLLLGWLVPLTWGIKQWWPILYKLKYYLILIVSLLIPSLYSFTSPDLNRLVILAPLFVVLISIGLSAMLVTFKTQKIWVLITALLIICQTLFLLADIGIREPVRLENQRYPYLTAK